MVGQTEVSGWTLCSGLAASTALQGRGIRGHGFSTCSNRLRQSRLSVAGPFLSERLRADAGRHFAVMTPFALKSLCA